MDRSFKWITKSCTAYSTEEPWQVRNPAPNSEKSCEANGSNSQIPDRNFIRPNRPHPPTSHLNKTAKRNGNTKEPENWCRIERVIFRCHKNHTSNGVIFVVTGQGLGAPLNHLDKSDQLGKSYWHRKTWKKQVFAVVALKQECSTMKNTNINILESSRATTSSFHFKSHHETLDGSKLN